MFSFHWWYIQYNNFSKIDIFWVLAGISKMLSLYFCYFDFTKKLKIENKGGKFKFSNVLFVHIGFHEKNWKLRRRAGNSNISTFNFTKKVSRNCFCNFFLILDNFQTFQFQWPSSDGNPQLLSPYPIKQMKVSSA